MLLGSDHLLSFLFNVTIEIQLEKAGKY